jgi:NTE family protein
MAQLSRRFFLKSATVGAAGLTAANSLAQTPDPAAGVAKNSAAVAASISEKLFSDDGLARRIPNTPTVSNLARGLDRTLVLGGGGEYYVAWYCGFFHGLLENGVDLNIAEMVVGTSAGAYAGSSLTSGEFSASQNRV